MARASSSSSDTKKTTKGVNDYHLEGRKLKDEGKFDAAVIESLRALELGLRSGHLKARHVELAIETCLDAQLPRIGEGLAAMVGDNLLSAKALVRLAQTARRQKKSAAVQDYIGRARAKGLTVLLAKAADKIEAETAAQ
jgi:hypothetical protein